MWLGWSLSSWETIFFWVTVSAAVCGALSLASAFFSAIIGYKISDVVTRDANVNIVEANARAEEAKAVAAEAVEKTEVLRQENVKLQTALETEHNERLRREALVAWRQPTKERLRKISAAIAGRADLPNLTILVVNDPEASVFSTFLLSALFDMLDKVVVKSIPLDSDISRFHAEGTKLYSFNEAKDPLASALKSSGLVDFVVDLSQLNGKTFFGLPIDRDTLVIGRKPPVPPVGMEPASPKANKATRAK